MTLPEITAAIEKRTARPDLQDEIFLAIQEATLFCHNADFYQRDYVEVPLVYNPPIAKGQFIVSTVLPSFRKIGYIRKYDPTSGEVGAFLLPVAPDKQFDYYQQKKQDVYYIAGRVVNWLSSTQDKAHIVAYWRFPDVSRSNFQSWIAEAHPFAIINKAASIIFRSTNNEGGERSALQAFAESKMLIDINEVESQGR